MRLVRPTHYLYMCLLNLLERHGRTDVTLHDYFQSAEDAGLFLKDVALNDRKSISLESYTGSSKLWKCTGQDCPWFVKLGLRRGQNKKKSKLSSIPPGAWFVSGMHLQHRDVCDAVPVLSVSQVRGLSGFQAAIVPGRETSRLRVVESVKAINHVDLSDQAATVYRAISAEILARTSLAEKQVGYDTLVAFLKKFAVLNSGSRVCCQMDNKCRFYQGFIAIGSVISRLNNLLPVYEIDGTHMKHPQYNGVCLTLIGKDGNKGNVLIAAGFVPKETKWNFAWFLSNCIAAGVSLADVALFTDRGLQLEAQMLLSQLGLQIHLKFCALHIVFDVCHRFKIIDPDIKRVQPFVFKLQACNSRRGYESVLREIRKEFPVPIHARSAKEEYIDDYLRKIHPTSWSRFGNFSHDEDDIAYIKKHWSKTPSYGSPKPLCGVRTTSGAEGENNALLWNSLRSSQVPAAFIRFCSRVMIAVNSSGRISSTWQTAKHDVTPYAKKVFDEELRKSTMLKLIRSPPQSYLAEEYYASQMETSSHIIRGSQFYRVNLESQQCSRCPVREMQVMPCRHLIAAIYKEKCVNRSLSIREELLRTFHRAYTISSFHRAFKDVSIFLPIESELDSDVAMHPPPHYRQAGRAVGPLKPKKDRQNYAKRYLSNGEVPYTRPPPSTEPDQASTVSNMLTEIGESILGPTTKSRSQYTCSTCGVPGHNSRRCTNTPGDVESVDEGIVAGEYVVNTSPYTACGVPQGWILLYIGDEQ